MPNKDGTGPQGKGPKTGRQKGNCKQVKENSSEELTPRGMRFGRRFINNK